MRKKKPPRLPGVTEPELAAISAFANLAAHLRNTGTPPQYLVRAMVSSIAAILAADIDDDAQREDVIDGLVHFLRDAVVSSRLILEAQDARETVH